MMRKVLIALLMVVFVSSFAFAATMDLMVLEAVKGDTGLIPVIVQMTPGAKVDVASMGGKLGYTYTVFNGFSADLPAAAINALAKNPNVTAISYNHEITVSMDVAAPTVNSDDLWAEGYTGEGVTIAIVDTGIAPHQDFQNRIIGFKDLVKGKTAPYDDHGHGTHCAGIAAGNGAVYDGAARDAYLVGVKVLNRRGSGTDATIIAGIDWVIANKATLGIDIMSMSLGGPVGESSVTDPVCVAVRNAWNAGLVVCVAAGNEGPSAETIGSPGNEPMIISVGAANDMGTINASDDTIAYFSSRGPTPIDGWSKPDICAPGYSITACDNATTGYVTMSGTSMATPLIAGICAQYLEAHPTASPNTVKADIMASGRTMGYDAYTEGDGLVDAYAAVH